MASHTPLNAGAEGVVARAGPTDSPHGTNEGIGTDHLLYFGRLRCIVEKCHMTLSVELASACRTRLNVSHMWVAILFRVQILARRTDILGFGHGFRQP